MTLLPTYSNLLCSLHEGHDSILAIPDSSEVEPYFVVEAVGPDCTHFQVGARVLFNPSLSIYSDTINGLKCCIVAESSVFARYDT